MANTFYLTGGTALAEFYLHHRYSEDLDFFTDKDIDDTKVDVFIKKVAAILQPKTIARQRIYDRRMRMLDFAGEQLKTEFVKYEFKNIKPEKIMKGIYVADIYDIAVNKLFTILDRNEVKDFVDLYFLFKKFTLDTLRNGVKRKFGYTLDDIGLGGDLLKVKNTLMMPKMVKKLTKEELISFFENETLKLQKNIFE